MYAISPDDEIRSISRLPAEGHREKSEGWLFLSLNRRWDSADRERLSQATGLYSLSPSFAELAPQSWWKAYARAYLAYRDPIAAVRTVGDPDDERWTAPASRKLRPIDVWRKLPSRIWRVEVAAADLLPMINVHFLLRLVSRSARHAASQFAQFVLVRPQQKLSVRHTGGSFEVPAWGSWPAPIAVNAKLFIRSVREATNDHILMRYEAGKLIIGANRLEAAEI